MLSATNRENARMTTSIPIETKDKFRRLSNFQRKQLSDFIRKTIEEKPSQMDRQNFEVRLKAAYQGMAEENIQISNDFKYADAENLRQN